MTRTSVTVPNCPKYSRSFSGVVCHERPPTKSLPGAESEDGVDRPVRDVKHIFKKVPGKSLFLNYLRV